MRPIIHEDVVAAARVILALPEAERQNALSRLIWQSAWADQYRKRTGRIHPFWGDGTLMTAALAHAPAAEPALSNTDYCACLALVFETLINRARNSHKAAQ